LDLSVIRRLTDNLYNLADSTLQPDADTGTELLQAEAYCENSLKREPGTLIKLNNLIPQKL